jgi:hypothetical protein
MGQRERGNKNPMKIGAWVHQTGNAKGGGASEGEQGQQVFEPRLWDCPR